MTASLTLDDLLNSRVHMLGIGGIGVSGVARLLAQQGARVSGCDVRESSIIDDLRAEGIPVAIGHSADHVDEADIVVYSTAVPGANPELQYAESCGRRLVHRSHVLGSMSAGYNTSIGVTGTNGKGTVTAMLAHMLNSAGLNPGYFVGALCSNLASNAATGGGRLFVAELDESDGSLVNIRPNMAIINNLELDHLNYYKDFEQTLDKMVEFVSGLQSPMTVFINGDDHGTRKLVPRLGNCRIVTFGEAEANNYVCRPLQVSNTHSSFEIWKRTNGALTLLGSFTLNVPGAYNMENAVGCVAVASELGVPVESQVRSLAGFMGLKNRYTAISSSGRTLIKDYMSHPAGIRKVLATARLGCPGRLVAVFKPYRYTMISYHASNYASAFSLADEVIVTRMWDGGEDPIPGVDTAWLAGQIAASGVKVTHIDKMEDIRPYLVGTLREGECSVFFGGNDLFDLSHDIASDLTNLS